MYNYQPSSAYAEHHKRSKELLVLKNIVKDYIAGDNTVRALNNVSIAFRKNEFVSVLGHSGCGKTTMLNIIGGLDRYTSGVMAIKGVSTEKYKDADWDTYRNHSIGFVFQTYNLIPHQTVLSNVELALTLSGVSSAERKRRAIEVLKKVGLGDQLHKKPNQMSGGQMQRVAIARALINDPEILLADEPTGALDTETSVQIMEILKEISHDKLIIMVTHNPELAEQYSDRIVRLKDGEITGDSNPYSIEEEEAESAEYLKEAETDTKDKKAKKRPSMSFLTALSLSFNNLLTKKTRTFLTSFAGSIGIIGIALILSLSNGINAYIAQVQEDTLSTYPLTLEKNSQDFSAMLGAMNAVGETEDHRDSNMVYVDDSMGTMVSAMSATVSNNLEKFKSYLEANREKIDPYISAIQYTYDFNLQVFSSDGKTQVNPTTLFDNMGPAFSGVTDMMNASGMSISVMSEMIDNQDLLDQQYDVVAGNWPKEANEIVLVISKNNQISKMTLYMLGVLDQSEVEDIMSELMKPGGNYNPPPVDPISFDDFLNMSFRLVNTSDFFKKTDKTYQVGDKNYPVWKDVRNDLDYSDKQASFVTSNGIELKISGIIRPKAGATATSISTTLAYTKGLTDYILAQNAESEIINQQKATGEYNVLTGLKFERTVYTPETIGKLIDTIDDATMETLYAYMTEQIHNNFVETPPVNKDTFLGFVSVMNAEEQAQLLSAMISAVSEKDPSGMMLAGLCTAISDETLTVTPQNLIRVYPILTKDKQMAAVVGLSQLCGEDAMAGVYEYMNDQLANMTVNKDNFEQLLMFIAYDEEIFNQLQDMLYQLAPQTDATLESTLYLLGDAESAKPATINFYAKDFESKDAIEAFIKEYNESAEEIDKIKYTDMVGLLMSSVTTIVNAISYVLIFFVSISLVVSSIMIGIITYISVLERTKEIGILRAIGASKRDVSRVFNAETLIVGFTSGMIGIIVTILLNIPISLIIHSLSDISGLATLPVAGAVILVIISMLLTFIAGLIPSGIAAKKDPVESLRSE